MAPGGSRLGLTGPTLAHEAYLKLVSARGIRCNNRAHFLALCSQMIRRILVDHARKRRARQTRRRIAGALG